MERFRFGRFLLDPVDRRLLADGAAVEVSARYLDALVLLVRERGRLVSKDRFMDEVWRGVPVTDEALTQCVRTLRRVLGDSAATPRFIETAPKHGYRFIAEVEVDAAPVGVAGSADGTPGPSVAGPWRPALRLGLAGALGGGVAGLVGGLAYGFVAASADGGAGAISIVLVLACVTALVALVGGAGVAFGIAASLVPARRVGPWMITGGVLGGVLVGGVVKLVGLDAFSLLFGRSPGGITGAGEGAVLGGALGLGAWLALRGEGGRRRDGALVAALIGAVAGGLIPLLGGRMMGGSLGLLAQRFPSSRLHLETLGAPFGEAGFGRLAQAAAGTVEGALFGACVVGAMILARRREPSGGR